MTLQPTNLLQYSNVPRRPGHHGKIRIGWVRTGRAGGQYLEKTVGGKRGTTCRAA